MKLLIWTFLLFSNIAMSQSSEKNLNDSQDIESTALDTALESAGIFDEKAELKIVSNDKKQIVFIGMLHIGRKEIYSDVAKKIDSLQKKGYFVFYELINNNSSKDSLINDIYKKKIRKIMGFNTHKYYDTINKMIGGKFKYEGDYKLINQPKHTELISNMEKAKNADVNLINLIDQFELKYGNVQLNTCDKLTKSNSTEYNCERISRELADKFSDELLVQYRNINLANEISNSKEKKIAIIYGKTHFDGLLIELKKIDKNWKTNIHVN